MIDLLARCRDDPDLFNTAVLNRPPFWSRQREMCASVVKYRISVFYSGNAIGKDYWLGDIPPWWLFTRPHSLVIVTGPSQTLLGSVTWKEIRRAVEGSKVLQAFHPKISAGVKTSPQTLTLAPGWQALGYSTTSVERASGQHAPQLLVIGEEASAIPEEIYDALDSLKYTRLVLIGNPLRAEGRFVDLIHQAAQDKRDGVPPHLAVNAIRIPSTESPDAQSERSEFGLADKTWLDDCERRYGRDSLWYRSHVLAEIPTLTNETLIPIEDLDRCTSAETDRIVTALRVKGSGGRRVLSCDVGEGCGNARTVIFVRDDLGILECHASRYTGPAQAAEVMGRLADKWAVKEEDVSYDGAGQTGKRLGNSLAGRGLIRARPYFGSSSGGKRCINLRTATALALARRLDPRHYRGPDREFVPFHIPVTPEWASIREELAALRYQLAGDKSCLEAKEDMSDRLGRSPDFADALTQTFREEAVRG